MNSEFVQSEDSYIKIVVFRRLEAENYYEMHKYLHHTLLKLGLSNNKYNKLENFRCMEI